MARVTVEDCLDVIPNRFYWPWLRQSVPSNCTRALSP